MIRCVAMMCDGQIAPPRDGFGGLLAVRVRDYIERRRRLIIILAGRGWSDPEDLSRLGVPIRNVPVDDYYTGGRQLKATLDLLRPDVLLVPNPRLVLSTWPLLASDCRLVLEVHEVVSELADQLGDSERVDAERIIERAAVDAADLTVCLTERDRELMTRGGSDPSRLIVRPCPPSFAPASRPSPAAGSSLVFLGNGFYEPNRRALEFLGRRVLPVLHRTARLFLVGRRPSLDELDGDPRVHNIGPSNRLRSDLRSAAIGLAPVWHATGVRMKILDYAAAGLATVATRRAAAGMPTSDGIVAVDEPDEFIGEVIRLTGDPIVRRRKQRSALRLARRLQRAYCEDSILAESQLRAIRPRSVRESAAAGRDVLQALKRFPRPRWLEETVRLGHMVSRT